MLPDFLTLIGFIFAIAIIAFILWRISVGFNSKQLFNKDNRRSAFDAVNGAFFDSYDRGYSPIILNRIIPTKGLTIFFFLSFSLLYFLSYILNIYKFELAGEIIFYFTSIMVFSFLMSHLAVIFPYYVNKDGKYIFAGDYYFRKDYHKARENFQKAIEIFPSEYSYHRLAETELAISYDEASPIYGRDYQKVLAILNEGLSHNPKSTFLIEMKKNIEKQIFNQQAI